jgi:hypothetical protein
MRYVFCSSTGTHPLMDYLVKSEVSQFKLQLILKLQTHFPENLY